MSTFLLDLRYGVRLLTKSPWFLLAAVVTLSLGIGANTAIFSAVNAVLLRPLPFRDPQRVVRLWENNLQKGRTRNPVSPPNFIDWREQNQVFEEVAAYSSWNPNVTGTASAERVQGVQVSVNLFQLLGVNPEAGRSFDAADNQSTDNRVVVISHGLWQRRFASDPNAVNSTLMLNGNSYILVGVMPPDFQFPLGAEKKDLWVPLSFDADDLKGRATRYLSVVARLKPGVTIDQARSEMQSVATQTAEQYPQTNSGWSVTIVPLYEQLVADTRSTLLVMLVAVGFVLLIGCANVANLMLARASGRQREVAVRMAIGASRARIIRQLLTESFLLATIGGGVGAALAFAGIKVIVAAAPDNIPRLKEISMDASMLAFTVAISLFTAFIFGLFPALQASKPDVNGMLKEGGRSMAGGRSALRFRKALVVTEVALALLLLVGAGLMIKSFARLVGVNSGFDARGVLTAQVTLPSYKYENGEQQMAFFKLLVDRVATLPGVQSAAVISYLPLSGSNMDWVFSIEGRAPTDSGEKLFAEYRQISSGYFQAMGIPLLKGRTFSDSDGAGTPKVIIINEAFVRRYFPNEDPLGRHVGFGTKPQWREIVGVVADVRHFGLEIEPKAEAYVPHLQDPWPAMALVVRSGSDPAALTGAIRSEVGALDKDQPAYNIRTMESLVSESVAPKRLAMLLFGIFSGVALVLAAVGVFGVMASSVTQRTHEIGIRMALGATPVTILKMIVSQAVGLALLGIVLGLTASIALTRFMSSLLYEVSTTDPTVLAGVSLVLTLVMIAASYIPARRATAVDPVTALRYE